MMTRFLIFLLNLDKKSPANNKIMYGTTVAKNLQRQSGNVPLYSDGSVAKFKNQIQGL
ncbi:hypothetical protein P7H95_12460 [Lactococcus lactis]|nr:hypothetical protein [Lactococcus lactis]